MLKRPRSSGRCLTLAHRRLRLATRLIAGAVLLAMANGCAAKERGSASGTSTQIEVSTPALNVAPKRSDFVLEAHNSIRVQTGSVVTGGDLGARGTGTGPFLSGDVAIDVLSGAQVQATRNLIGDSVRLGTGVRAGDIQTNRFVDGSGSTHGSVTAFVPLPLLPAASPVSPGTSNVTVAAGATVTAAPGRFATVSIGAGGKWRPAGGNYDLAALSLASNARIEALGPVQLRIAGRLTTAAGARIGAAPGVTLMARDVRIEVSAVNGTTGTLAATPKAAAVGTGNQIRALLLVPNGTLAFGSGLQASGAFFARDVDIGSGAQIAFQNGFTDLTCTPPSCDDGNPCTADACASGTCTHTVATAGTSCADSNLCNGAETCNGAGSCVPGAPVQCTALDACHDPGMCNPSTGTCSSPNKPDGTSCNDENACTLIDACESGACTGAFWVECPAAGPCRLAGTCHPGSGVCSDPVAPDGAACNDGNACTTGDACGSGSCTGGAAVACDDGNGCTDDRCDSTVGCVFANNTASCDDDNACTTGDVCGSGSCTGGAAVACDDGNGCTDDRCDATAGCVFANNTAACDDGNVCTTGDVCQSGTCVSGSPIVCTAQDECEEPGVCDPRTGQCTPGEPIPGCGIPPDPATIAPSLDNSVAWNLYDSTRFIYEGSPPIQVDVAPGSIDPVRTAVVRGRVRNRAGEPLPGVTVAFHEHPELGSTRTREDGWFDLVANGGDAITLQYSRSGFLPAQRTVSLDWHDFEELAEVVLVQLDPIATEVTTDGPDAVVAQGTPTSDERGTRQLSVLFPPGTQALLEMPDGSTSALDRFHVRLTEYTVGDAGPASMPAALPPRSAYTFAFEAHVEEAEAAGAKSVRFDPPVPGYVENFLGLPVGSAVPFGYYDGELSAWVPSPDGRIIEIVAVDGGIASVALTQPGVPSPPEDLAAEGFSDSELLRLAELYEPGRAVWRVRLPHFSPCDWNFIWGAPPDSIWPENETPPPNTWRCPDDIATSSVIECPGQVLTESVPIVGTDLSLNYRSDWVPGFAASRQIRVQLTNDRPLSSSIERIDLVLDVAGKRQGQSFEPQRNLFANVSWDGQDAYGRALEGQPRATISIGYVYPPSVLAGSINVGSTNASFGGVASGVIGGVMGPVESILWQTYVLDGPGVGRLSVRDARHQGLGGWMLNVHHVYDPVGKVLYMGDGRRVDATSVHATLSSVTIQLTPRDIVAAPDGSFYISDSTNRIRHVANDGTIMIIAGSGASAPPETGIGDGGPAISAYLNTPSGLARDTRGNLYVADWGNHRIRRIAPDGVITTVAGNGTAGYGGDGGPATSAMLNSPVAVAVTTDGTMYIADNGNNRIRRVASNGVISTFLGTGATSWDSIGAEEGVHASTASVFFPGEVAVDDSGNVYFVDARYPYGGDDDRVRKVDARGIVSTVAGCICDWRGPQRWGVPGTETRVNQAGSIAIGRDGSLYVSGIIGDTAVQRIAPNGTIWPFAGGGGVQIGGSNGGGDGGPAVSLDARFSNVAGVALSPDGSLLIADGFFYDGQHQSISNVVRRVSSPLPGFSNDNLVIPSSDGTELFEFDRRGRHLRTVDAYTGAARHTFSYDDASGRLTAVVDGDGNRVAVERDATDHPTIVGPDGHETTLEIGDHGFVTAITSPGSVGMLIESEPNGLLRVLTDARGGRHEYTFDADGRLATSTDPAGGGHTFTRSSIYDVDTELELRGFEVDRTTGEGAITTYRHEFEEGGAFHKTVTDPAGFDATTDVYADERFSSVSADGTEVSGRRRGHSRFGTQVLVPVDTTVRLPSGLSWSSTFSESTALDDARALASEVRITTVNGRPYVAEYTASRREWKTTSPAGREIITREDTQGRLTEVSVTGLEPLTITYDGRGRVTGTFQGADDELRATSFAYGTNGFVASLVDPLGDLVGFERDARGRVSTQTLPGGRSVGFGYDAADNVTGVTPPGKPSHDFDYTPVDLMSLYDPPPLASIADASTSYEYNLDRDVTMVHRPGGLEIGYQYDAAGRLGYVALPAGYGIAAEAISFAYDAATGQLASVDHSAGVSIDYGYDGFLVTSETVWGVAAGPVTVVRGFDSDFRIASESVNGSFAVSFGYDGDSLLTQAGALALARRPDNGLLDGTALGLVTDAWSYNAFAEPASYVASVSGAEVFRTDFTRDKLSRITQKIESIDGVTSVFDYTYDLAGRLETVDKDGVQVSAYGYDDDGNRLDAFTSFPAERSVSASYDDQDRLLSYGTTTFTYTDSGELLTKTESGETTAYAYDVMGNLRTVSLPDGRQIDYLVDGRGRRVGKRVDGVLAQVFIYGSQLAPAAEFDGSGNVVARFVYGTKVNVPEYTVKGGVTYRIVTDHLASPRVVIETSSGAIVQRVDYDEFGQVLADTNPGFQPFGFAGGLYDTDTWLVRFGARDYDAVTGRWRAKDPILFEGGDTNLYEYAGGDPVNFIDPNGMLFGGAVDAGEEYGDSAAAYWADVYNNSEGPAAWGAAFMGGLASLWTPCTSDSTFTVLSSATGLAGAGRAGLRIVGGTRSNWIGLVKQGRGQLVHLGKHPLPMRDLVRTFSREVAGELRNTPLSHIGIGDTHIPFKGLFGGLF